MIELKYVILALAATLLVSVAGIIYLATQALTVPDILEMVTVGSLTALAGVLVPAGRSG